MTVKQVGNRVGDWFLWIECEVAKTDSYRKIPVVSLRKAISGGDILATVVATHQMANELRKAADNIDAMIASLEDGDKGGAA